MFEECSHKLTAVTVRALLMLNCCSEAVVAHIHVWSDIEILELLADLHHIIPAFF